MLHNFNGRGFPVPDPVNQRRKPKIDRGVVAQRLAVVEGIIFGNQFRKVIVRVKTCLREKTKNNSLS